jgi:hypothetical protein
VSRSGSWTEQATSNASGGHYLYSSGQTTDALTLAFSGTQLDVVYVKHPAFGSFAIEVDGAVLQTVDAHADSVQFGAIVSLDNLTPGSHIARVYAVTGTVALDAFRVETVNVPPATAIPVEATPASTQAPTAEPTKEPTVVPTQLPTAEATQAQQTAVPTAIPSTEPATSTPVATVLPVTIEAENPLVSPVGTWTLQANNAASGGQYLVSSGQPNDALSLSFVGNQAAVVYVNEPGTLAVEVDGVVKQTITGNSQQPFSGQVTVDNLAPGNHVLRIYAVTGIIAVDGFVAQAAASTPVGPTITPVSPTATSQPTDVPTLAPSNTPTAVPTNTPTEPPTQIPTDTPTVVPTNTPAATLTPVPPTDTPEIPTATS